MAALTNKRGIFSLLDVRERQSTGNWSVKSDVWLSTPSGSGLINFGTGVKSTPQTGYFGGGFPGPVQYSPVSTVNRIDYSNDTATASPKGPLSLARYGLAATGNSSFGYFGGGSPLVSTVDRIDYSSDTATASPKGPLSLARYGLAATGNSSFGYFGGGYAPSSYRSTVDRIDYSNDTATASPKGPLSDARYQLAATGNSSFGYFGGGTPIPSVSTVNRIDYSNDTATASPKGPLSSARYSLAATSARANGSPQ